MHRGTTEAARPVGVECVCFGFFGAGVVVVDDVDEAGDVDDADDAGGEADPVVDVECVRLVEWAGVDACFRRTVVVEGAGPGATVFADATAVGLPVDVDFGLEEPHAAMATASASPTVTPTAREHAFQCGWSNGAVI
jgi:hypothetical protein